MATLPPPLAIMTINKVWSLFICLEEKKKKKSGLTKLLNLVSPRSKRRGNDGGNGRGDDNDNNKDKGVPRKTLVTATIWALNGPTIKLTDMYSSLTFKQEILGEAAPNNNNGVKAKPGENHHQDGEKYDKNNDGDGGAFAGFAGSTGGSQSRAQPVCRQ
jgi:hypothetical protein